MAHYGATWDRKSPSDIVVQWADEADHVAIGDMPDEFHILEYAQEHLKKAIAEHAMGRCLNARKVASKVSMAMEIFGEREKPDHPATLYEGRSGLMITVDPTTGFNRPATIEELDAAKLEEDKKKVEEEKLGKEEKKFQPVFHDDGLNDDGDPITVSGEMKLEQIVTNFTAIQFSQIHVLEANQNKLSDNQRNAQDEVNKVGSCVVSMKRELKELSEQIKKEFATMSEYNRANFKEIRHELKKLNAPKKKE
eukprot:g10337.t1